MAVRPKRVQTSLAKKSVAYMSFWMLKNSPYHHGGLHIVAQLVARDKKFSPIWLRPMGRLEGQGCYGVVIRGKNG
ncbi:MAG: hypothetical protein A2X49_04790 [Lentisphaerae bacterium GWF2_52_8]|nr:MAG: hypothetical protein A2X49_04790 [Lentisphaerae bacterium GWF2_52_8]